MGKCFSKNKSKTITINAKIKNKTNELETDEKKENTSVKFDLKNENETRKRQSLRMPEMLRVSLKTIYEGD